MAGEEGAPVRLRREMGLWSAVSMLLGVMIGSGVFVTPTTALRNSGSVGLCLIVWALCGPVSLLGALAFAELGTVVPRSGAEYAYFREAFAGLHPFWGPMPAFVCAWTYVVALKPAEVAVMVMVFVDYTLGPAKGSLGVDRLGPGELAALEKLLALLTLGLITYVNMVSVRLYVRLQNAFATCKVLACLVVVVGGAVWIARGNVDNLRDPFAGTRTDAGGLALAFYGGLWAYDGWTAAAAVTEEIRDPSRNVPRSVLIAVPLVTVLYVGMNVAYLAALTVPETIEAPAVAVAFGERALGPFGPLVPVGVAVATFGCALSLQFGVSRLCYVAGEDGNAARAFSYVHAERLTPAPAVAFQGALAALFVLVGDVQELIVFASFLIWIFYGGAMVALLVLRRTRPELPRPYRVPSWVPWFVLAVSAFLSVLPIVHEPSLKYLFAVGFLAVGVAAYTRFVYARKVPRFMDRLTYSVQMLFLAVPPDRKPEHD